MRVNSVLPLVLSALLLASPALAQSRYDRSGAPLTVQQSSGVGRLWNPPADQQMTRFEREEQRRRLNMTDEEAEAEYGEERVELARQVMALMDEGKCREARALANEHGERQMAMRVRQTCRAR